MEYYISRCVSEADVEKLKELKRRTPKENVAKALDRHFQDLQAKKVKSR